MENLKDQFIDFMLSAGALRFGNFTTKSGRQTPYFINTGAYVRASQIEKLGEFYAHVLHNTFGDEVDNLFGPAYKGIPLAVTASIALNKIYGRDVTYTFNRKEAKDHGEGGTLVGDDYGKVKAGPHQDQLSNSNCRVVIIEDVTTAGTSIRESLPLFTKPGVTPVGLVVSVDRMERGVGERAALQEIREDYGLKTAAVVSLLDILAYLESGKGTRFLDGDATLLDRMKLYRKTYGVE